ncbi:MAG TPA: thioredoxin family protein [Thermoanaerobaculaceae bacterium]|nr:thioredoxin family protein [Thermoanaerobaculaceae bacterium]
MKRAISAVLLATAGVLAATSAAALPAIGDPIPAAGVKMANVDGRELSIASVAGAKGTLVIFSCNHCPWVRAWEDRIVALAAEAKAKGVGVIAINSNDPSAYPGDTFDLMKERATAKGYGFPYVVDATSEVARAFGATHTPEAFLFDAAGKLAYHGAIDDNARDAAKVTQHYLQDAVDAVVAGKPVPTAETKALGCSLQLRAK